MAHNNSDIWERHFFFQGRKLFYNRIPHNHISERCIEIPIAFDFLARLEDKSKILEIGNTLSYYENSLSDSVGIRNRRIVDKFESDLGVDNVDMMDLPSEEKYSAIVSVSTVEHIGQGLTDGDKYGGKYGEEKEIRDLELPLKAIAKIYDLLTFKGKALITVPFGRLIDYGWLIHFSTEYLRIVETKFGVPKEAISISFIKRLAMQQSGNNPYQLWVEANESELSEIAYGAFGPAASAIAIIELIKLSENFVLDINVPSTSLVYEHPRQPNEPNNQWRSECTINELYDCLS